MARFETAWATLSTCQVRSFYKLLTESKAKEILKFAQKVHLHLLIIGEPVVLALHTGPEEVGV